MKVFLTGATGFIGTVISRQLIDAGYQVTGLARTDAASQSLIAAGVQPHIGDLEDLESLRSGAQKSDGVIHTGFIHDFTRFAEVCEIDRRAIEALGSALVGSDRPLIVTSGTALGSASPGVPATEDFFNRNDPIPRAASEHASEALAERGVNCSVVRLPQVHDPIKQGFVTLIIAIAREKGVSAYSCEGLNRWPAAHVEDVARLYRLAFEKGAVGARYHAVAEEGVPVRQIAESIARGLNIPLVSKSPEESAEHFGWMNMFAALDMPASSALTRERLNWNPTGPGLISDLDQARF